MHRILPALVLLPGLASAQTFSAKVIGVTDGDSITVLRGGKATKVDLYGIDCPEKGQPYWKKARQLTHKLVYGRVVQFQVQVRAKKKQPLLARVIFDAERDELTGWRRPSCLNEALVASGLARWHREQAPKEPTLAKLEAQAKRARRGLWGGASAPLAGKINRRVRLSGRAAEAKAGSVVVLDGTSEPVYVKGLQGWGKLLGKRVAVTGMLRRKKLIPNPVLSKSGAVSAGAVGRQYVIEDASWSTVKRSTMKRQPMKRQLTPKHSACYEACLRRSSMQAVGWEAIKARCRSRCSARKKKPR